MQDVPALLCRMSDRYHEAIALLASQGIDKRSPDYQNHLHNQIKALALEQDKAATDTCFNEGEPSQRSVLIN